MKLTLATNIGRPDAKKLGLDFEKAKKGDTVDVKQDVADIMLRNGWALRTDGKTVEAVPHSSATEIPSQILNEGESAEKPDFDSMTVAELRDFAKENEIEGVTTNLNRDETVAAVKKGFRKVSR